MTKKPKTQAKPKAKPQAKPEVKGVVVEAVRGDDKASGFVALFAEHIKPS